MSKGEAKQAKSCDLKKKKSKRERGKKKGRGRDRDRDKRGVEGLKREVGWVIGQSDDRTPRMK